MADSMQCPKCGWVHSSDVQQCRCGWNSAWASEQSEQREQTVPDPTQVGVGFWTRLLAYFIDIIPITAAVVLVFYFFLGFDTILENYLAKGRNNVEVRREFLLARNRIRNISLSVYLAYCGIMEASAFRGSLGKWLLGIVVVNADGTPLTRAQAALRNSTKILSFLPCGMGFLWIAISQRSQGWHDKLANTIVIRRPRSVRSTDFGAADDEWGKSAFANH